MSLRNSYNHGEFPPPGQPNYYNSLDYGNPGYYDDYSSIRYCYPFETYEPVQFPQAPRGYAPPQSSAYVPDQYEAQHYSQYTVQPPEDYFGRTHSAYEPDPASLMSSYTIWVDHYGSMNGMVVGEDDSNTRVIQFLKRELDDSYGDPRDAESTSQISPLATFDRLIHDKLKTLKSPIYDNPSRPGDPNPPPSPSKSSNSHMIEQWKREREILEKVFGNEPAQRRPGKGFEESEKAGKRRRVCPDY